MIAALPVYTIVLRVPFATVCLASLYDSVTLCSLTRDLKCRVT